MDDENRINESGFGDGMGEIVVGGISLTEQFFSSLSLFFSCVMVCMCLAGAVMNTVSLFIFTRPSFRKRSINVLLSGLSASDLVLCILAIPVFCFSQLQQIIPGISFTMLAQILVYAYPVTIMAQTMSVWMLVSITVDRYLAVCHPFLVRIYCTTTRALITTAVIFIFSVGYNFVRFWEYTISDDPNTPEDMLIVGLLRENQIYMVLYQNIAMLLTQFVLPLMVLCILNLQVAKTILEAGETRRELVASEKREHSTAKMMLFVVIVFIFCYMLSFCLNVLEIFNPDLFKNPIGFLLNDVNNILVVINSSSSFIFYVKYSSRYRAQLRTMPIVAFFVARCCFESRNTNFSDKSAERSENYMTLTGYSSRQTVYTSNSPQDTSQVEGTLKPPVRKF
ncbi:unnamed protein product [Bursaphelenchus okinawaensis]|uniref:G-protein coupled receptors family 1 profile domain-containing protein n=1 Tax=Bursaphelenchus okinawaensis TaxID=465554 RepID=A0A811L5T2_9BILA|nr:unnamed protein product [Bursaphelenchus okinawaensis]CAG9119974.1 unnamed protein product [Bursaphelenchus okinawaensis]